MAKPKSFSEYVKSAGISKDTVEKLGLVGELKKILDKNYRFFVRKNGKIDNFEEFVADYQRDGDSYQGTVNGFLELLEKDLATKDIYTTEQDDALRKWQERSIRASKEEESRLLAERDQELADSTGRLQEAGYDTSTMSDDDILAKGREMRAEEAARMDMIDSDIDFDAIPDDWLQALPIFGTRAKKGQISTIKTEQGNIVAIDGTPLLLYSGQKGATLNELQAKPIWTTDNIGLAKDMFLGKSDNSQMFIGYIKSDNPLIVDGKGANWHSIENPFAKGRRTARVKTDDIVKEAWNKGYDAVIFKNIAEAKNMMFKIKSNVVVPKNAQTQTIFEEDLEYTFAQSAYAGSRVDYDRPSLEAIGTGEGAQVHGWGLYYALDKDIAERYREMFTGDAALKYDEEKLLRLYEKHQNYC